MDSCFERFSKVGRNRKPEIFFHLTKQKQIYGKYKFEKEKISLKKQS